MKSFLSLYKAIQRGDIPKCLLAMCLENGSRSRSHGLSVKILQVQTKSLDIPLVEFWKVF